MVFQGAQLQTNKQIYKIRTIENSHNQHNIKIISIGPALVVSKNIQKIRTLIESDSIATLVEGVREFKTV